MKTVFFYSCWDIVFCCYNCWEFAAAVATKKLVFWYSTENCFCYCSCWVFYLCCSNCWEKDSLLYLLHKRKTKNKVAAAVTDKNPFSIVKDLGIYHLILFPPLTILFSIHVFSYINLWYGLILWVLSIIIIMMILYNLTRMLL